jgi:hypothetical protein
LANRILPIHIQDSQMVKKADGFLENVANIVKNGLEIRTCDLQRVVRRFRNDRLNVTRGSKSGMLVRVRFGVPGKGCLCEVWTHPEVE